MEILTKSAKETNILGQKVGIDLIEGKIKPHILTLYGELGSGKTTFVQGMAKSLGIQKRILSPTFILSRRYKIQSSRFNYS